MLGMLLSAAGGIALGLTARDEYDLLTRIVSAGMIVLGTLVTVGVF